jgi:MarR-like DNA-binding transcriptional regulator SgrR of sgrS sRNA
MKNYRWIFAFVVLAAGLYLAQALLKRGLAMSDTLRVAFPKNLPSRDYEPTRIHLAPEYIFLENVYSPLVELSPEDATIRSGLADKWEWKNDELHFFIREGLKTIDGKAITAEDAAFSLKRLLVRTQNTHGNLKDLVCGGFEVKSIEDVCPGISFKNNELILKIAGKSAFILPMLSGIDFAIIPKSSVDPKTLDIVDYRNTSGPYYVSRDSETGEIELSANKSHYHYSKNIPQKIQLVPVDPKNKSGSLQLFKDNKVDFITTIDSARSEEVYELNKDSSGSEFHSTANIRTFALFFTERGIKELSQNQRILIGQKIKSSVGAHFLKLAGYENTDQFFPQHGDGAIDAATAKQISDRQTANLDLSNLNVALTIVRVGNLDVYKKQISQAMPSANISEGTTLPSFQKFEKLSDMPHAYIAGPDTGFNEDISLISYSLTAGFFGLTEAERQSWLADYMSKPNKDDRLKMLQRIHESSLRDALFIPLFAGPYTALAKSGWKIHLSKILANNPLWLITKD